MKHSNMKHSNMKQIPYYIPDDIIREHILPYTYEPQPKSLCDDIRNFHNIFHELETMYESIYQNGYENEYIDWLDNDISRFMNQDFPTMFGYRDFYLQFYRRMYRLQYAHNNKIISFFENEDLNPFRTKIQRRIALMTPSERNDLKSFLVEIN